MFKYVDINESEKFTSIVDVVITYIWNWKNLPHTNDVYFLVSLSYFVSRLLNGICRMTSIKVKALP